MFRRISILTIAALLTGLIFVGTEKSANAQVVTTLSPVQPTVTYLPERRGLFGQRLVYRPVVTYGTTVAAGTTTYYAPSATTTYYAPSATTTYYAPSATTAYYAPSSAPVTTYYSPSTTSAPVTYYSPSASAPVTTYYAPSANVATPPVTTYYAPSGVTTYYAPVIGY